MSQYDWYKSNNAPAEILHWVKQESGAAGATGEELVRHFIGGTRSTNTIWDINCGDAKIEVKTSRFKPRMRTWMGWQHLNPHKCSSEAQPDGYDYIIFVGVHFQDVHYYITKSSSFVKWVELFAKEERADIEYARDRGLELRNMRPHEKRKIRKARGSEGPVPIAKSHLLRQSGKEAAHQFGLPHGDFFVKHSVLASSEVCPLFCERDFLLFMNK